MPARPGKEGRETMTCRACGEEDRASEGYPCTGCGTFICLICTMRDITLCRDCAARTVKPPRTPGTMR
ncbi:MAG: hypothetical protein ABR551_09015 [Gemmatimonadales bacterium]